MKKRFKISYVRPGVIYEHKYATTVAGAVRIARKKLGDSSDLCPYTAEIYERSGAVEYWERVATVSTERIIAEDNQSRRSYRAACLQRDEAEAVIKSTYMTMVALNGIADKEA